VSHRGPGVLPVCLLAGAVLFSMARPASAQIAAVTSRVPPGPGAAGPNAAESFDETYGELLGLAPVASRVAQVKDLILQRDIARFTLRQGRLYQLSPIGGRTIGLVFVGQGRFAFAPESRIEQDRLQRIEKVRAIDTPVSAVLFLFADSTIAELGSKVTFAHGEIPGEVRDRVKDGLKHLVDETSHTPDPDLMSALLNQRDSELFYAHIVRPSGGPFMYRLDPEEFEAVQLESKVSSRRWGRQREVITQFPRQGVARPAGFNAERVNQAVVEKYTIETTLSPTGIGEIDFTAAATMDIMADAPVGPWVAFELFEKLKVDSARWAGGSPARTFRGKESGLVWLRLDGALRAGESRTVTLYYHGDLIDRVVDFFHIKSSAAWYPRSLEGRSLARFDLTFNTSDAYLLASVGERVDSSAAGHKVRTRWVTPGRIRNASFNLGLFQDYSVREDGIPPVTVMMSDESHRKLGGGGGGMQKRVGEDMTKSLRFFQRVYGPTSGIKHFYATETPGFDGEAFPGMIDLSFATFLSTVPQGDDEVFRAHEVAHQWWGIGVDFASYHDQWLSEGFADFSGLWYLQTVTGKKEKYFDMLRQWRQPILMRRTEPGPISLGYRVMAAKDDDRDDYQTVVYKKGAWVLHMLRVMTLDLRNMSETKFTETMTDFYRSYEGQRASTDDFRRVVERHVGSDMRWFFDQWVYGATIPTYRVSSKTQTGSDGQFQVMLRVKQEDVPDDFMMYVPVTVDLGKDQVARFRVKVKGPLTEVTLPVPAKPKGVKFNDFEGVLAEVKNEGWGS
jgi:hypothetical protein